MHKLRYSVLASSECRWKAGVGIHIRVQYYLLWTRDVERIKSLST